jgi:hypothetical protein
MNRWCAGEMALMVASARPKQAFRRFRPSLTVSVGDATTQVTYPSWPAVKRSLAPHFKTLSVEALTFLLPPYAWPVLASHGRTFRVLTRIDEVLATRPPFALLGDHLLVVAERR